MVCQFGFLKKLKVKLWYFYSLVSGFSLGGCFGLLDALVPPLADLCPMPEGSQSQAVRLSGPAQLLRVTFPSAAPGAVPAVRSCWLLSWKSSECAPEPPSSLGDSSGADHEQQTGSPCSPGLKGLTSPSLPCLDSCSRWGADLCGDVEAQGLPRAVPAAGLQAEKHLPHLCRGEYRGGWEPAWKWARHSSAGK